MGVNRTRAKLSRLSKMDGRELSARALQAVRQRRDALYYALGRRPVSPQILASQLPAAKFFFDHEAIPRILEKWRALLPPQVESLLERANRICRHEFDLLGYVGVSYGREIDWSRDAIHGREAPLIPWYRIDLFDFSRVGDPKITWELNRHQHLVTLAKAWWLTADDRFVCELFAQWQSWIDQNPYPLGINWTSSLEVGFRSISWLWVRALLAEHALFSPGLRRRMSEALALHGAHIRRYLSTYSSPNTHLLGEAVALLFIGLLCPEIAASEQWRELGWKIVQEQLQRQVLPDGMHFEQSTYYHVYALDFFLHSRLLAARNGLVIPGEYDSALERMLEILASLCATGDPPRFGDDDGGRLFDGQRNRAGHLADPLPTGAVLFGREDWKQPGSHVREETLWLLGAEAVRQFEQLRPNHFSPVNFFPHAGIYRFADSHSELILDAGPLGTGSGGHGHADALSLAWKIHGQEVLCDPGTYTYSEANGRNRWRSTAAHNTLEIDERSQSDPAGPFAWRNLAESVVTLSTSGEGFAFLRAGHNGYARLQEPAVHTRCLYHSDNDLLLVRDVVEGSGTHKLRLSWHLASDLSPRWCSDSHIVLESAGRTIACLHFPEDSSWHRTLEESFISPAYGVREKAPVLRLTRTGALPAETATVLVPATLTSENLSLHYDQSASATGGVAIYQLRRGRLLDRFVFNAGRCTWKLEDWVSDAEFFRVQLTNDELTSVCAISVSGLSLRGREILNQADRLEWLDWKKGTRPSLSSTGDGRIADVLGNLLAHANPAAGKVNA
jgi:hypothetical protein